jgi:hypothetical protein
MDSLINFSFLLFFKIKYDRKVLFTECDDSGKTVLLDHAVTTGKKNGY